MARRYAKSGSEASGRNAPQYFTSRRPPRRLRRTALGRHINDRRDEVGKRQHVRRKLRCRRQGGGPRSTYVESGTLRKISSPSGRENSRRRRASSLLPFLSSRPTRHARRDSRRARHASCHLPYPNALAGHGENASLFLPGDRTIFTGFLVSHARRGPSGPSRSREYNFERSRRSPCATGIRMA